jgi:hypothetical protein
VVRVEWREAPEDEDDDGSRYVWVYVTDESERLIVDEEAIDFVCDHPAKASGVIGLVYELLRTSGVASLIAAILTVTICFAYLRHSDAKDFKPPDILANALTIVLGFYFGAAATKVRGQ